MQINTIIWNYGIGNEGILEIFISYNKQKTLEYLIYRKI